MRRAAPAPPQHRPVAGRPGSRNGGPFGPGAALRPALAGPAARDQPGGQEAATRSRRGRRAGVAWAHGAAVSHRATSRTRMPVRLRTAASSRIVRRDLHHSTEPGPASMRVTVIGAGHVGLVTAACLAHVGHDVVVDDDDASKLTSSAKAAPGSTSRASAARRGGPGGAAPGRGRQGRGGEARDRDLHLRRHPEPGDGSPTWPSSRRWPGWRAACPRASSGWSAEAGVPVQTGERVARVIAREARPRPTGRSPPTPSSCARARPWSTPSTRTAWSSAPAPSGAWPPCASSTTRSWSARARRSWPPTGPPPS